MMSLFDEEQIMKTYVKDMQKEAAKETAKRMFRKGMSLEDIADCSPLLSIDELKEIESESFSMA
jgi:hypothetical protein